MHSFEFQAPWSATDQAMFPPGVVGWATGCDPVTRQPLPGYDTGISCLLIFLFLILAFNSSNCTTFIKTFAQDLWDTRKRENLFNKVNTLSETRIQLSLLLLTCITEGILIGIWFPVAGLNTMGAIMLVSALAAVYLAAQRMVYWLAGFTFAGDADLSRLWIRGFTASQCILGLGLAVPAVLILFYPDAAVGVGILAIGLYVTARLIFISKGFRLFYDGIGSLLYFILYLCTLEIAPILLIWRVGVSLQ